MQKNSNIALKILCCFLLVVLSACTNDFEEINKNQTGLTADRFDEDLLFTRATVYGALRYTEFQRSQHLYAQHYMQYYAMAIPNFPTGRYVTVNDWLTSYWREAYADFGMQCQQIINLTAEVESKANKNSIAKIWKVFIMHRLTDFWGDVPYFEAFQGDLTPAYTPQEEIYNDMLAVLKAEAEALNTPEVENFGGSDLIYDGKPQDWIRFANSLRLRLAMRLSEIDPVLAEQHVREVLTDNNVISTNEQSAVMPYGLDFGNADENKQPMSLFRTFAGTGEYRVSNTLVDYLQDNNDPRLEIYIETVETEGLEGQYIGLRNGLNAQELSQLSKDNFSRDSEIISGAYSPTGLLIYPEVLFLRAEAALRGWGPGNAADLYNQGIAASINYWNAVYADLQERIPSDDQTALPNLNITDSLINAYITQPSIAYNPATGVQQIITQKWLALINQGFEAYAEYRRTGFPQLNPIPNTNGESETGGTELPRRIRYPVEEQALNREQYNAAITRQGADLPTTRMWWDAN